MNLRLLIDDKKNLHTVLLCLLVMFSVTMVSIAPLENARTINLLEIAYIIAGLIFLGEKPSISAIANKSPIVFSLLCVWAVCVLISFYFSPYQISRFDIAWQRLYQTLSHVALFSFVWFFIGQHGLKFRWVVYAVAASSLIVVATHTAVVTLLPAENLVNYFPAPPLNSHIRHTGYQIAAAICLLLPMIYIQGNMLVQFARYVTLLVLVAFLIWLGGRGADLTVLVAAGFVAVALKIRGQRIGNFLVAIVVIFLLGSAISEYLAVFDWNGLIYSYNKTVTSADLNQVSSGRLEIWKSTIVALKDNLWFGLGSQAYIFMPNRIYGVQPHSFIFQFLVEWGLIGSTLFLVLLGLGVYTGLKRLLKNNFDKASLMILSAGSLIIAMVFHATFDGIFYHPQPSMYLAIAFAVWISPKELVDG